MSANLGAAYLSPADAAAELACSSDSILRAIDRGDLQAIRYGRLVRIPRHEFDEFLARHRTGSSRARIRRVPA